jgi:hypothetical protein
MDPIIILGIIVALAGLAGGVWSVLVHVRDNRAASAENAARPRRTGASLIGTALVFTIVFALGLGIMLVAVRGRSGGDTEGHWRAHFEIDGQTYEGELDVRGNAGPLTVTYATARGRSRARQQCSVRRQGQQVTIRCRDARVIDGEGTYSPDNFDLSFANPTTLHGRISSQNGSSVGSAVFTRP